MGAHRIPRCTCRAEVFLPVARVVFAMSPCFGYKGGGAKKAHRQGGEEYETEVGEEVTVVFFPFCLRRPGFMLSARFWVIRVYFLF